VYTKFILFTVHVFHFLQPASGSDSKLISIYLGMVSIQKRRLICSSDLNATTKMAGNAISLAQASKFQNLYRETHSGSVDG
jgi:hypothetical protein